MVPSTKTECDYLYGYIKKHTHESEQKRWTLEIHLGTQKKKKKKKKNAWFNLLYLFTLAIHSYLSHCSLLGFGIKLLQMGCFFDLVALDQTCVKLTHHYLLPWVICALYGQTKWILGEKIEALNEIFWKPHTALYQKPLPNTELGHKHCYQTSKRVSIQQKSLCKPENTQTKPPHTGNCPVNAHCARSLSHADNSYPWD